MAGKSKVFARKDFEETNSEPQSNSLLPLFSLYLENSQTTAKHFYGSILERIASLNQASKDELVFVLIQLMDQIMFKHDWSYLVKLYSLLILFIRDGQQQVILMIKNRNSSKDLGYINEKIASTEQQSRLCFTLAKLQLNYIFELTQHYILFQFDIDIGSRLKLLKILIQNEYILSHLLTSSEPACSSYLLLLSEFTLHYMLAKSYFSSKQPLNLPSNDFLEYFQQYEIFMTINRVLENAKWKIHLKGLAVFEVNRQTNQKLEQRYKEEKENGSKNSKKAEDSKYQKQKQQAIKLCGKIIKTRLSSPIISEKIKALEQMVSRKTSNFL